MAEQDLMQMLNFNFHFPNVDGDLLKLAITPRGLALPEDISARLESKYHLAGVKRITKLSNFMATLHYQYFLLTDTSTITV